MKKEISEQLYLVTNGPLDAKVSPVDNVSDLLAIPRAHRYRGMTVMVLNKDSEEEACEYWLKDGTKDSNWVKKTKETPWFDPTDYYTSAETVELIAEAMGAETARTEATYLKEHQSLEGYATGEYVDSAITDAINAEVERTEETYLKEHQSLDGYATENYVDSAVSQLQATIESTYITADEAEASFENLHNTVTSETSSAISEAIATETARTEATYLKEHQSLADYYTSAQTDSAITETIAQIEIPSIEGLASEDYVDSAITSAFEELKEYVDEGAEVVAQALSNVFTSADTESAITEAIEELKDYVDEGAEVVAQALSNIYTSAETDSAISTAIEELREYVDEGGEVIAQTLSNVYTSGETDEAISRALENFDSNHYTKAETDSAIREAISGATFDEYATKEYVANQMAAETARTEATYLKEHQSLDNYYTSAQTDSAITEAIGEIVTEIEKDEKVVAAALNDLHSGITTINEILESAVTSADVQEAIEDAMAAETARTETTYLKEHQSLTDYYTSAQTDTAIATAMASETARTETTYLKEHQSLADYYTSGETDSKIDSALTDYMTVSELNERFSVLEKKPAVIYQHDGNNPICGQTGNLFTNTVWHTLSDVELSNYSRLRIYVNPSKHNVSSTDNLTSAAVFELSLDNGSLTSDVIYYSGGIMVPCLNNGDHIYSLTAMVRKDNDAWQIAFKAVSLYGTSSTDITNSYIYKIEGSL